jgi:hypothetical protein
MAAQPPASVLLDGDDATDRAFVSKYPRKGRISSVFCALFNSAVGGRNRSSALHDLENPVPPTIAWRRGTGRAGIYRVLPKLAT